jgi:ATP-dependent DNA helicase RecG
VDATGVGGPSAAKRTNGKRKPRVVTEKLDPAQRRVGGLSVFGIRDFWRVPTILPKRYLDLRCPLIRFDRLASGQWVCVGGRASGLVQLPPRPASAAGEIEDASDDDPTDEGPLSGLDDPATAPLADAPPSAAPIPRWSFRLLDMDRRALVVEIEQQTRADEQLLERVRAGHSLWLHGQLIGDPDALVLVDVQPVTPAQLGETHPLYPGRTVRERRPANGKAGRKRPTKLRWQLRKISPAVVGALVREKNRLAIGRAATVLRERMGVTELTDEWELMEAVGSPLPTLEATFKLVHAPPSIESAELAVRALERLAAIEVLQHIHARRRDRAESATPLRLSPRQFRAALDSLREHAGITLTPEQTLAALEIVGDLAAPHRTHRLLSGDVGSGKTLVFAVVAACVHAAGHLVVILEPRTQLAEQVHRNLARYFPDIPLQLLTGASTDQEAIARGIIVGTTGVWSRLAAAGCRPALAIADEQQKYSVEQRRPEQYAEAHLVEATATPIPRSQGLIEFGGLDVSVLRRAHAAKQISTQLLVGRPQLDALYKRLLRRLARDNLNVLLVFPRIEAVGDESAQSSDVPLAVEQALAYWREHFPGRVGVIHGRLAQEQRTEALRRFEAGEDRVLIGTSILEVGIDLRQADVMVIHHPERFGVAAVHQLRGRLARQGGRGWCYLACSAGVTDAQRALLKLMETESDGFRLALADMERRGVGDMRQHARQQSGAYQGFLVQRSPRIEDLEWAMEHCQRWLRPDGGERDLLADSRSDLERMARLAPPSRAQSAPTLAADGEPPLGGEQMDLFALPPSEDGAPA